MRKIFVLIELENKSGQDILTTFSYLKIYFCAKNCKSQSPQFKPSLMTFLG